jgi:regulator of replication initiation timing
VAATGKTGAALPLEIADASGATVDDKVAILVAHQVATETAALTAQIDDLKAENATLATENASLKDKVEVAETAKLAAEKAFADFKDEQAKAAETAKLAEDRKAEIAKVAPALLEGEKAKVDERVARWAALDEASFKEHLNELASVAGKPVEGEPLETAMKRNQKTVTTGKSAAVAVLGLS